MTNLLTVKETAARLRICPASVYTLVRTGRLTVHRPSGLRGKILVRAEEIDRYLSAGKIKSNAELEATS